MNWKWVLILALLLLLVIFTTQNYEIVEIKFLLWNFAANRAIVIFFFLITGVVIGRALNLIKLK